MALQESSHTHVATHIRTLRCFIGSHNKHLEHTTACSMHQRAGFGEASTYMLLALRFLEINSRTVFLPSPGQKNGVFVFICSHVCEVRTEVQHPNTKIGASKKTLLHFILLVASIWILIMAHHPRKTG